eukprot:gene7853-12324_t
MEQLQLDISEKEKRIKDIEEKLKKQNTRKETEANNFVQKKRQMIETPFSEEKNTVTNTEQTIGTSDESPLNESSLEDFIFDISSLL